MKFTKMQGAGNDYVYINCFEENVSSPAELAVRLSDRHFGVGGDGLILIKPSDVADVKMEMYNADGSEGGMCGNGIRCVAKYAIDHGIVSGDSIRVETKSGVKDITVRSEGGKVVEATVNMGAPILTPRLIPMKHDGKAFIGQRIECGGKEYSGTAVSMGNPHLVIFVGNVDVLELDRIGHGFEYHPLFPDRVNTEFARVLGRGELSVRVWERGSGETLACGTGACAAVVASVLGGYCDRNVTVHLRGGDLRIHWDEATGCVMLTGGAVEVFSGELTI